jgi:hypothetical protein
MAIDGGCGATLLFASPGPAASLGLQTNVWASAAPIDAGIVAYFWGDPPYLVAGTVRAGGQSNKVLWISDGTQTGSLSVAAHPLNAESPEVRFDIPPASSPHGNFPSSIDLPTPGCWHLDLTLGETLATIDVLVAPAPAD